MWDARQTDPQIHAAAIVIARRCVNIIQVCLRDEEVIEATREFYGVIREELERWKASKTA